MIQFHIFNFSFDLVQDVRFSFGKCDELSSHFMTFYGQTINRKTD